MGLGFAGILAYQQAGERRGTFYLRPSLPALAVDDNSIAD